MTIRKTKTDSAIGVKLASLGMEVLPKEEAGESNSQDKDGQNAALLASLMTALKEWWTV